MTSSAAMNIKFLHCQNLPFLRYIHCNFRLNLHITHNVMKENVSGCFFSEHSVQLKLYSHGSNVSASSRYRHSNISVSSLRSLGLVSVSASYMYIRLIYNPGIYYNRPTLPLTICAMLWQDFGPCTIEIFFMLILLYYFLARNDKEAMDEIKVIHRRP